MIVTSYCTEFVPNGSCLIGKPHKMLVRAVGVYRLRKGGPMHFALSRESIEELREWKEKTGPHTWINLNPACWLSNKSGGECWPNLKGRNLPKPGQFSEIIHTDKGWRLDKPFVPVENWMMNYPEGDGLKYFL